MSHYSSNNMKSSSYSPKSKQGPKMDVETASISTFSSSTSTLKPKSKPSSSSWTPEKIQSQAFQTQGSGNWS